MVFEKLQSADGGHVWHKAHVNLGDGAMWQDGFAAGTRVSADQTFDVDGGFGLEPDQRINPVGVVHPVIDSKLFLDGGFVAAASCTICSCAGVRGLALSKKPATAGVCPSGPTSVLSALIRCHDGLSTCASRLEWMSCLGPRPQRSPLETSSSSTTPLAPSEI